MGAQLQRDAFLVFRALCKLSIRSGSEGTPGAEATTLRGKLLALELLKILLENSGPRFRHGERYAAAIKQYLCLSLLKNCQSAAVPAAVRLCASIFLTLLTKFRSGLKAEVGVFFPMILLRPIEVNAGGAAPSAAGAARCAAGRCACVEGGRVHGPASTHSLLTNHWRRGWRRGRAGGHFAQGGGAALCAGHVRGRAAPRGPVCQLRLRPGGARGRALPQPRMCVHAGPAAALAYFPSGRLITLAPSLSLRAWPPIRRHQGANLFERTVAALVRIAQGGPAAHDTSAQSALEEQAIRYEALRCLVSMLKSMAAWHSSLTAVAAAPAPGPELSARSVGGPEASVVVAEEAAEAMKSTWMESMAAQQQGSGGVGSHAGEGTLAAAAGGGAGGGDAEQKQGQLLESWKAYKRQFAEARRGEERC